MIRLRVLGPVELEDGEGATIRSVLAQPKRLALLVYLAESRRDFHRRDSLLARFWPELDAAHGRAALSQAARFLRRELGDAGSELLVRRGLEELGVARERLWCDAAAFLDHVDEGRWADALALYRGDFLEGFFIADAAGFEEWLERERLRLRACAERAARALADERARAGDLETALASARRAVALGDTDERVLRELLLLLDRAGDRAGAVQAYTDFARRMREQIDAEPSAETRALIGTIRSRAGAPERLAAPTTEPPVEPPTEAPATQVVIPALVPAAPASHVRPAPAPAPRRWSRWRVRFGALALFAGTIASASFVASMRDVWPFASLLARGTLRPQENLLVTDFRVVGLDSSVGTAVAVAVRDALARSTVVKIVPADMVAWGLEHLRQPRTARLDLALGRQVALRLGLRAVVDGHVVRTGRRFDVGLRLVSADSGRDLVVLHAPADAPDDVIPTLDRLTRQLRSHIGESLASVRASPAMESTTTSSLEALRFYVAGMRHLSDPKRQIDLFGRAVQLDTEYALAWRGLSVAYASLDIENAAAESATVRAYRYGARLSEWERLWIEAWYRGGPNRGQTRYDRARVIAIYEQLLALADSNVMSNLAEALWSRRDFARSEAIERVFLRMRPRGPNRFGNYAQRLIDQGRLDEADSILDLGLARRPGVWKIERPKIRMLYLRGRLDAYARALDSLYALHDPVRRRDAAHLLADHALLRGRLRDWARWREEIRAFDEAEGSETSSFDDAWADANVDFRLRGDASRAVGVLREALDHRSPRRRQLLEAGAFLAEAGQPGLAQDLLRRWARLADTAAHRVDAPWVHRLLAQVAVAEGRTEDAIAEIRLGDAYPDGPVDACFVCLDLSLGRAFDRGGERDSAIAHLERFASTPFSERAPVDAVNLAPVLRRLGELYEARGDRDQARRCHARFVDLWRGADAELQPQVDAVRRRMRPAAQ